MRISLWVKLDFNFRMPFILVAATCVTFSSMATALCDTGSSAFSVRKANNKVSRDKTDNQSSRKSAAVNNVPMEGGIPTSSNSQQKSEKSAISRRTGNQQRSLDSHRKSVPWQDLRLSQSSETLADQTETTSSRGSDRSKTRGWENGKLGSSPQVSRPKSNVSPDIESREGSSRIAWSALGFKRSADAVVAQKSKVEEIENQRGAAEQLAFQNELITPPPQHSVVTQFPTPEVSHRSNPTVASKQLAAIPISLPAENNELPSVESSLSSSTPEFALIERATVNSEASQQPANLRMPAADLVRDDLSHSLIEELPVVYTLSDNPQKAPIGSLMTEEAELPVDQFQSAAAQDSHTLLVSNVAKLNQGQSINLNQIATFQNPTSNVSPIGILPIARLTQSDTNRSISNTYSTEKYTGPMASAEELFFNLNVSGEFQSLSGEALQSQRTSSNPEATNFHWLPGFYTWASPSFYHRPLYFEQPNLERYGMGPHRCMQPLVSGMHFFGSIALTPYKMLTQHPYERVYSLGHQRPGDRACYQRGSLLGQSRIGEVCRYWDEYSGYQ